MPIENSEDNKRRDEACQLEYSPKGFARTFTFQLLENSLGVLTKETHKRVFQRMLRFAVMPVFVDRNPIGRVTMIVGPIGVTLMMLHVNALVKNLAEPDRDRFHDAE